MTRQPVSRNNTSCLPVTGSDEDEKNFSMIQRRPSAEAAQCCVTHSLQASPAYHEDLTTFCVLFGCHVR